MLHRMIYLLKQFSKEQYSIKYADAKNNEFFITSEKGIKAMEKYKQSLIQKYNYN